MKPEAPIGIFDSGIGGLTVVRAVRDALPSENIIYFGDTARVPYGNKSKETIIKYSLEIAEFLVSHGAKMIIAACNTASSLAIEALRDRHNLPVIGVIDSVAKKAALLGKGGKVGVIGTEATVESGAYTKAIRKTDPALPVISRACPMFVPLVEEGWLTGRITELTAEVYLKPIKDNGVKVLILGCTHYPLLIPVISQSMGNNTALLESGSVIANEIKAILEHRGIINSYSSAGSLTCYVSDSPRRFARVGEPFLGHRLGPVTLVE